MDLLNMIPLGMPERPHRPHEIFATPDDHSDPTWDHNPSFAEHLLQIKLRKSLLFDCFITQLPSQCQSLQQSV